MVSFYSIMADRFIPIQRMLIDENANWVELHRGAFILPAQQVRIVVYSSNPTEVSINPASETRLYATLYWREQNADAKINDTFSLDSVQYTITATKMTILGRISYAMQNL